MSTAKSDSPGLFDDQTLPTALEDTPADVNRARRAAITKLVTYEACAEAIDALYHAARGSKGNQAFFDFLDFAKRFSHMALFNAMMCKVQRPGSVLAATRKQWDSIGRWPRPDAIPLVILRPFSPLDFAYDIDDTEGQPLPEGDHNFFRAEGELRTADLNQIKRIAKGNYVLIEGTDQYGSSLAGTAATIHELPDVLYGVRHSWRVRYNLRHEPPVQLATLAHELGHIFCGHLGAHPRGDWPARPGLSYAQREIEAEAVCWLVCQRRGITPNAPEYLRDLVLEHPNLNSVSMWSIFHAANRIEGGRPRDRSGEG